MYPSENISTTSSLFHFSSPSPYINCQDDFVFLQNLNDLFTSTDINMSTQVTDNKNMEDSITSTTLDPMVQKQGNKNKSSTKREPNKRTSKKDRHSKIDTLHGPRDRRMRLCLDVARKFFGLQDLLGFEKASKTVAWLLAQSESAIKDLARAVNNADINSSNNNGSNSNINVVTSASSTSECEVLSGIKEMRVELGKPKVKASPDKKRKGGTVRREAFDSTARELREKARERARERTERKRNLQVGDRLNLSRLGSTPSPPKYGSYVEVENPSSNDETNAIDDDEGINTINEYDIFGDYFWSSSTFFNYHHNSTNSHEIPELQAYAKTWEGYNCI